ncbi:unnamed protein product, partial [Symbiodinium sp. CCMP2456]
ASGMLLPNGKKRPTRGPAAKKQRLAEQATDGGNEGNGPSAKPVLTPSELAAVAAALQSSSDSEDQEEGAEEETCTRDECVMPVDLHEPFGWHESEIPPPPPILKAQGQVTEGLPKRRLPPPKTKASVAAAPSEPAIAESQDDDAYCGPEDVPPPTEDVSSASGEEGGRGQK